MTEPAPPEVAEAAALVAVPEEVEDDAEAVSLDKAQKLISRILETQLNPNPKLIHSLASLLEVHEASYVRESNPSYNNSRGSYTIGKLANLIRDNDEFYELVFSKYLAENRFPISISSASARLLIICSSSWMFPHVFEDTVLDNIKSWVMEDGAISGDTNQNNWKYLGKNKPTDNELLRTYSVGLLAIALSSGGQVVEDILTSGVSAKLMHYLRVRVLGEASSSQKDNSTLPPASLSIRAKDKSRTIDSISRPIHGDKLLVDTIGGCESLTDSSSELVGSYEENGDVNNNDTTNLELLEGKGRSIDENSIRVSKKGKSINRGKNERLLISPGSNRSTKDRSMVKNERNLDAKKNLTGVDLHNNSSGLGFGVIEEANDNNKNDERLRDCSIGSKDISDIVLKAILAAENEARSAGAPFDAAKAAGDAAAEFVKSAALEVWNEKKDEEAAVIAANQAASTVIDAAMSTDVSRSNSDQPKEAKEGPTEPKHEEEEPNEDTLLEDFTILDQEPLYKLREIYCIQSLEILGEYVEALGPILHEKGVDVCLSILQRSLKDQDATKLLLPEILKLVCVLGAHRKFAALFVDRGGIQKLLEVPRVPQTFIGLSSCLFTIGTLQGIMERVSALPCDVVSRVVDLALELLECKQDPATKNSAIFFASAFVFRAILDSFDSKDGLQKFLNILQAAAAVRSGNPSPNPNPNPEVLTASEKQIAYHTCVALRQYFRAHLLLLVDSLRPNKAARGGGRGGSGATRLAYKPMDISNEALDAVFVQVQRDRKLGTNLVRARWPVVDKFLALNGHITTLELCQAPPVERYLHELAQYGFGILHIVTFVPCTRKLIVTAPLSNNRVGMAVILDAASGVGYVDPEVIRPALNVLINLVCPPPSISNKLTSIPVTNNPQPALSHPLPTSEKTSTTSAVMLAGRISLGSGAGCAGLAAQLEQGYRHAREAVRANNGIKVLLNLLNSRMITPPGMLDSIRALACRVLLGLAIDDTIAHILTKLQVGKKLSELIRDSSGQPSGGEHARWQVELTNVAIELIAILTNSGKATTLAATDAAAPALRRIERAAIAAATPISYHSKELLQLIHDHLQATGLKSTADMLKKEADLIPLPCTSTGGTGTGPLHQTALLEPPPPPLHWPSTRTNNAFLSLKPVQDGDVSAKQEPESVVKKKPLIFSSESRSNSSIKASEIPPMESNADVAGEAGTSSAVKTPIVLPLKRKWNELKDLISATPSAAKRIATADLMSYQSPNCFTPGPIRRPADVSSLLSPTSLTLSGRANFNSIPIDNLDDGNYTPGILPPTGTTASSSSNLAAGAGTCTDTQLVCTERMTLDSLVVQYLKHQHRQCPAPITTLPPLSLLQPHVCPEPSRLLGAPPNATARMAAREIRKQFSGVQYSRRDRQLIYSRFRPFRPCRDDFTLLTCMAFMGDSSRICTGTHSGELKIFDCNTGNLVELLPSHQTPVTMLQSVQSTNTNLLLSSTLYEARLWDSYAMNGGPLHSFDNCKAAQFCHSGAYFAALSCDGSSRKEVLLYDVERGSLEMRFADNGSGTRTGGAKGHVPSLIHFSPDDDLILWNGVLWDRRSGNSLHRFDQFTDYGGGGFHPAGNEVILNSEVWDLRKFKLLRSVPCLDQTVIKFNGTGDVIYAILRRNLEDVSSAIHTRRVRHPLFPAFRTIDSATYSEIATVQVDRCVLDLAVDPTDSFVGVVAMDDHEEMFSLARVYEIGRRRPTDDDSDPDDAGESSDDESDEEESDPDETDNMLADLAAVAGDTDESDDLESVDDLDDDDDDVIEMGSTESDEGDGAEDLDYGAAQGLLDIMDGEDGDGDDSEVVESFSSEEDFGF